MRKIDELQEDIIEEFSVFDDWMDKYSYLIEIADELPMIDEKYKNSEHLIDGCQSRVWIHSDIVDGNMILTGDSDAIIVKGLVSLLLRVFSGHTPAEIASVEPYFIEKIGMRENLSPTRANGLLSMIKRIKLLACQELS